MDALYWRAVIQGILGTILFVALIVWPAGTFHYWQGWLFLAVFSAARICRLNCQISLTGGLNYYRANRSGPPTLGQDTRLSASAADNVKLEGPSIVKVPTLVIWGMQDMRLLPQNLDGLEQFVPMLTR